MGEFKAGALFLALVVYFLALIITLTMVENVANEYDLDYGITTSGNTSLIDNSNFYTGQETCLDPRKAYNVGTGEYEELSYFNAYSSQCKYTSGALSEGLCNEVSGCTWENDTIFYFFTTSGQSCEGLVNMSTLGITENFTIANDFSGTIEDENGRLISCALDGLSENSCLLLGCQWGIQEQSDDDVSLGTILSVTGSLFTYQATFTDNVFINLILTTLLFYIPFIALLIALYFSLPFLH